MAKQPFFNEMQILTIVQFYKFQNFIILENYSIIDI